MGSLPGSGRTPGAGHGNPLQYSCLENPMDRGAWRASVHRVANSQTWLKGKHACMCQIWGRMFQVRELQVQSPEAGPNQACSRSHKEACMAGAEGPELSPPPPRKSLLPSGSVTPPTLCGLPRVSYSLAFAHIALGFAIIF